MSYENESEMWDTIARNDRPTAPVAVLEPTATAPASTRVTEPQLYPTSWRQDYVARLTGADWRYRVGRTFCERGHKTTDGRKVYGAWVREPGVYESRIKNVKRWEMFDGRRWAGIPNLPDLAKRITGVDVDGIVGTLERRDATTWDSYCILCDADVERFTVDGWPVCDDHYPTLGEPESDDPCEILFDESEVPF